MKATVVYGGCNVTVLRLDNREAIVFGSEGRWIIQFADSTCPWGSSDTRKDAIATARQILEKEAA